MDAAPGTTPASAVAVHTLTSAARDVVESALPALWVRGEVSDFKAHRNGHWYFSLRDAQGQVRSVVWASQQRRIPAPPDDGMAVVAFGQLTVWPVRGDLQFAVSRLEAEGDGLWRKALEATRRRLEADGLLDPARKRPLPRFPRRVAVITSADGAALHDVVTVARGRSPDVEIVLIPARVQGDGAPESLCEALARLARWGGCDVLVFGRGGGAREDLWAFNDERVVRALAACPVPTVSAVGHEIDVTLSDLVADCRAATPSAAAELVVPSRRELQGQVGALGRRLVTAARRREERAVRGLAHGTERLARAAARLVERRHDRLAAGAARLEALSPLAVLQRGYAVARAPDGASLRRRAAFAPGVPFELWVRDGIIDAVPTGVRAHDPDPSSPPAESP